MDELHSALSPNQKQRLQSSAADRIRAWEAATSDASREQEETIAKEAATSVQNHIVDRVFSEEDCDRITAAVRQAAVRRGGWDTERHAKYPTTDMPLAEAGAAVEKLCRQNIFERVLRPLATSYYGPTCLPEHLCYRDVFFVRYLVAAEGEATAQSELGLHTDGSTFSFNIALSTPDIDFKGGGTYFEHDGSIVRPSKGCALVHGGQVRHGGARITAGERLLLIGFVGSEVLSKTYNSKLGRWAAFHAWCKFGDGVFSA